eukprot:2608081-Amphidinium_carterae.1
MDHYLDVAKRSDIDCACAGVYSIACSQVFAKVGSIISLVVPQLRHRRPTPTPPQFQGLRKVGPWDWGGVGVDPRFIISRHLATICGKCFLRWDWGVVGVDPRFPNDVETWVQLRLMKAVFLFLTRSWPPAAVRFTTLSCLLSADCDPKTLL